ncbi:MAG: GAF domain-containing protein, partial [Myxococcota bacterium]
MSRFNLLDTVAHCPTSVQSRGTLESDTDPAFAGLIELASRICEAPIALVLLLDDEQPWCRADLGQVSQGVAGLDSLRALTILGDGPLVITDTSNDPRTIYNPLVTGVEEIRFYAGVPFADASGEAIGALCVMDTCPREISTAALTQLGLLGEQASALVQLRR